MTKLVMLALVLSFDTLLASISLGTLGLERSMKRNLVFLFALCDGVASLAGSVLSTRVLGGGSFWPAALQGITVSFYLLLIVAFAVYEPAIRRNHRGFALFYALPVVLCLDNLTSGLSQSLTGIDLSVAAVTVGVVSGLMACAGLLIGSEVRRLLPVRAAIIAGVACFVATVALR